MEERLRIKLTVRLFTEEKCFGPGVAELLVRVREHDSLRAAAANMEMAYSKAWKIIRQSEAALGCKLLTSSTGGRGGGGAVLTPEAEQLLAAYGLCCEKLQRMPRTCWRNTSPSIPTGRLPSLMRKQRKSPKSLPSDPRTRRKDA